MRQMKHICLLTICVLCLAFLSLLPSHAAMVELGNSGYVLDAELVVIVKPDATDIFRIEEILMDEVKSSLHVGSTITLPKFRLFTPQSYGPETVDPITDNTRILLYLRRKPTKPATWLIAQSGLAFFWVQDPTKVTELRKQAQEAIRVLRRWQAAKNIPDVKKRIRALCTFLETDDLRFNAVTQKELQRIGTPAGNYLADRLDGMSHYCRQYLLLNLSLYKSNRLHRALIRHLRGQQRQFESLVKSRKKTDTWSVDAWGSSQEVMEIWGELYYGLTGLAKFHDRKDLPFVRKLALWAVKYRFKQTCDAALDAFKEMPEKANLPVIGAIWKEFSVHQYKGNEMSEVDVLYTLFKHKYPESVPVVVQFLSDKSHSAETRSFLTELVGRDLGPKPDKWLSWYKWQMAKQSHVRRLR